MKYKPIVLLLAAITASLLCPSARADKAEEIKRDAARLAQIKTIALVPVVAQVRFDQGKDIPDPSRVAARVDAVGILPEMLERKLKAGNYTLQPPEAASLAYKEIGWTPTDLYITHNASTWESPSETISNHKHDEAVLLNTRNVMKNTPHEMTLYRFRWHDSSEPNIGLASFEMNASAVPDPTKLKILFSKLAVDALLLVQVTELETHEGHAGLGGVLGHDFKSTRIHIQCSLIAASDGVVIWQARARGRASQQAGAFTGHRAYESEAREAASAADQAVDMLLSDMKDGGGSPAK